MTVPPRRLFGTDGISGTANKAPMDAGIALRLGQGPGFLNRGTTATAWSSARTRAFPATCWSRR